MEKNNIIKIIQYMGFTLDYDQWDVAGKEWMRFELKDKSLDEKALRLIWWKDEPDYYNFKNAANILFKAGQKKKIQSINTLLEL